MADSKEDAPPTHEEFKTALATATAAATAESNTETACTLLLAHEKKTRLAGDAFATAEACVALVQLLWQRRDLKALNAHILILAKRRAQLKQAITKMVQEAMTYIDAMPDEESRVELITTLRTVTDGRIYVEVERARLTLSLAKLYEARGDTAQACETLQQVAVETFGSMDKLEKAAFLLEQMRLCLVQKDFVRMQIIANKVSVKALNEDGFSEVKLKFYDLMIQLHTHSKDTQALRGDYVAVYGTQSVLDDDARWKAALSSVAVFLALSPWGNETSDLEHRFLLDKRMDDLPEFKRLLQALTTPEIIAWPLADDATLRRHPVLADDDWHALLHKRILQHNIRIISQYYSRIRFDRLCSLLSLDHAATEAHLSEMVTEKYVYAKIDRPAGIISFSRKKPAEEVLGEWSADVSTLLGLVEKTCHLINKENMVHGIKTK